MNLLHGDHAAAATESPLFTVVTICSHEIGTPCTILARGRAYGMYSLRTIDVLGD